MHPIPESEDADPILRGSIYGPGIGPVADGGMRVIGDLIT